jgi:RND family efflux transporter MFP subunit
MLGILISVIIISSFLGRYWIIQNSERKAQIELNAADAEHPFTLTQSDITKAQIQTLLIGLPVTGTLRAKDTALITARVPGVLQDVTVREGNTVHEGQVLARIGAGEYDQRYQQAQLQAQAAGAQMEIAQRQYDNNVALEQQGFISSTALATSRANFDAARANYQAAQAGAAVAKHSVSDTVLKAPIAGTVSRRLVQAGEHVVPQQPLLEIVDLSQLEMQAPISPSDSVKVRVTQTARLTVEGAPYPVTATVSRINPSAQVGSRDVLVYLALPTDQTGLRQGLFAQGMLQTGTIQGLAVPLDAVRTDRPQPYVQTIKDGRVHFVMVALGARGVVSTDAPVEGLDSSEQVVATPSDAATWVVITPLGTQGGEQANNTIGSGDLVLRGTAGALTEGMAVVSTPQT